MCIDFSKYAKNMKIFVSHVNAHQRVTSAKDFNNQLDRMSHSMDTNQPLSLATPVITQQAHKQNSKGVRVEVMHGIANMADLATVIAQQLT